MDDPIFESWFIDEGKRLPSKPRWRSPSTGMPPLREGSPRISRAEEDSAGPAERAPEERSSLLQAVEALERLARRLHLERHGAELEYELTGSPVRVRMQVRPWRGPLPETPEPPGGTIEIVATDPDDRLTVRCMMDGRPETATEEIIEPGEPVRHELEPLLVAFARRVFGAVMPFDG